MQKYSWWSTKSQGGDGHTPSDAKGYALANLTNYWCTDEVLSAVEDGTYKEGMFDDDMTVDTSFQGDATGESSAVDPAL